MAFPSPSATAILGLTRPLCPPSPVRLSMTRNLRKCDFHHFNIINNTNKLLTIIPDASQNAYNLWLKKESSDNSIDRFFVAVCEVRHNRSFHSISNNGRPDSTFFILYSGSRHMFRRPYRSWSLQIPFSWPNLSASLHLNSNSASTKSSFQLFSVTNRRRVTS